MNNFLDKINPHQNTQIEKIRNCNLTISQYGLYLDEQDIQDIVSSRNEALELTHRFEFGDWVVNKIIMEFCDSPYIKKEDFKEIVCELTEIFFFYKNETKDLISDDELISFMKKNFDGVCNGSVDYLKNTVLSRMASNVLNGKAMEE